MNSLFRSYYEIPYFLPSVDIVLDTVVVRLTHCHSVCRLMERALFVSQLIDTVLTGEVQFSQVITTGINSPYEELVKQIKASWPICNSSGDDESHEIKISSQVNLPPTNWPNIK